jgi:cell wall assembly regulator SMI1
MIKHDQMIEDRVIGLIRQIALVGKGPISIEGTTNQEIRKFEKIHNLTLPPEVREWFLRCNGANVGPGGFYSLFSTDREDCSVDWYLREYPEWEKNGWIPITDDGCGDLYILATSIIIPSTNTHPVFFLDQADDSPSYVVASGLWRFLLFMLENEILGGKGEDAYWPFDKTKVLAVDPHIIECQKFPLPWET